MLYNSVCYHSHDQTLILLIMYDYRLDWIPLSSLTIINNENFVIEHKRIIEIITGEEKLVDQ